MNILEQVCVDHAWVKSIDRDRAIPCLQAPSQLVGKQNIGELALTVTQMRRVVNSVGEQRQVCVNKSYTALHMFCCF